MISVVIATYGDQRWRDLAWSRAYPSALGQADDVTVIYDPDGTVASTRNEGAATAKGEWLLFLDADDEIASGYIAAMTAAILVGEPWESAAGTAAPANLYTPRVQYVHRGRGGQPFFHPEIAPQDGNWLVIGTVVPRWLFREVGGFEEWPIYEDWALFARMQKAGADVVRVPDAVYRAWRKAGPTRNHAFDRPGKLAAHAQIRRAVYPELCEEAPA